MKKEYLLIVTPFFVLLLAYGLFEKGQYYLATGLVIIYLAFVLGFDKLKINLGKGKSISLEDKNDNSNP